ncbi:hypothetical protein GGF46_001204 [Coemansia sp. RSA 552]|nr:hypothetical protein GGF46_001204 [Coemansia sp. RSA 552]
MHTAASSASPHTEFPTHGLLPRADTQAAEFVRKHPTYDGRGTVVAILDTGIDPRAQGLQVTSDGQRKVVDYIDCTGSGDVALGPPQTCTGDTLEVRGTSGRTLRLNAAWSNPSGQWRVGAKRLYDIAPPDVKINAQRERDEYFGKTAQQLADAVGTRKSAYAGDDSDDERIELDAQADSLSALRGAYSDLGPLYDCVVFHDGEQWRAAVDTAESGDLTQAPAMGAYRRTGDVGLLSKRHLLSYTLNFYDQGRTLSIVTSVGTHSTHVAGIVAANHPEEPQNNGVAPGAQLLSLMIGDHRVGSMETGVGLTRAANAIVEHQADLANMSFGEPSSTANVGQWVQMVRKEVVRRHRCIFVSSAGNEGPALTTAGAPGGTSDDIIGVGAYVGYEQMKADHGMFETVKDTVFTWCSRGPTADGARGIDVYAPGSAIASFPAYAKERLHLANGTSMSSPNLCGCLALLVSAWKQELGADATQRISPYRVRNAIISTAKPVGDNIHGAGMVQTDAAWQFLKAHVTREYEDVGYDVRVADSVDMRGIYLRDAEESAHARHMRIQVTPVFPTDARSKLECDSDGERGQQESERQFGFEQRAVLVATASWISVPDAVYIGGKGSSFAVRIDPTQLEPGRLHTAAIEAYDSANVDRGSIFSVPVTVTKPLPVSSSACVELGHLRFQPTEIIRRFVDVPLGATCAKIVLRMANTAAQESAPAMFYLHCMQLSPQERFRAHELKQRVTVGHQSYVAGGGTAAQQYGTRMDVIGGATLEVCLAQFWSQVGAHEIDVRISFSGVLPASGGCAYAGKDQLRSGVVVNGNYTVARADFTASVKPEYSIKPVATLRRLRSALRPQTSAISPIDSERDIHLATGSTIYKLVLDYKLETKADGVSLRLRAPAIDTEIYESWADDFALSIFDANKRRIVTQISYTDSVTLKKCGDYLIRVQIRHRSAKDLEALKDMPLVTEIQLKSPVKLQTTYNLASMLTKTVQGNPFRGGAIPMGGRMALFFDTNVKSLPSEALPGDTLVGSLSLSDNTANLALEYIVPAKTIKSSKSSDSSPGKGSDKKDADDKEESQADKDAKGLEEALRKVRIDWIKNTKDDEARSSLVARLLADADGKDDADEQQAVILAVQLESIGGASTALPWSEEARMGESSAKQAVAIGDRIDGLVRSRALTARLYENQEKVTSEADKKLKQQADTAKKQLVDALTSKCRALAFLAMQSSFSATASEASAEFVNVGPEDASDEHIRAYEAAVAELGRWTEKQQQKSSAAYLVATTPLFIAKQQHGRALQPVLEWLAKAPLQASNAAERKSMTELRDLLLTKLQWTVWSDYFRSLALVESPSAYEPL